MYNRSKKALYKSIIEKVSIEVKHALNEMENNSISFYDDILPSISSNMSIEKAKEKIKPLLISYIEYTIKEVNYDIEAFVEKIADNYNDIYESCYHFKKLENFIISPLIKSYTSTNRHINDYLLIELQYHKFRAVIKTHKYETKFSGGYYYNDLYISAIDKNERFENLTFKSFSTDLYLNIVDKLCEEIFEIIITPYIEKLSYDKNNDATKNSVLLKYNMTKVTNYFDWFKLNIKSILKNNPYPILIKVNYSDYNGSIDSLYYSKNLNVYWISLTAYSGSADYEANDKLENLLLLDSNDEYKFSKFDKDGMEYSGDIDDAWYRCEVENLNKLAKCIYIEVKKNINNNKIK